MKRPIKKSARRQSVWSFPPSQVTKRVALDATDVTPDDIARQRKHIHKLKAALRFLDRLRNKLWIAIESEPYDGNLPDWHRALAALDRLRVLVATCAGEGVTALQHALMNNGQL